MVTTAERSFEELGGVAGLETTFLRQSHRATGVIEAALRYRESLE
jgi:hypothetical protein